MKEQDLSFNKLEFDASMQEQKERSKQAGRVEKGDWSVLIANESEEGMVDDADIYYYVGDDVDLAFIVPGQEILLDEMFIVREVV